MSSIITITIKTIRASGLASILENIKTKEQHSLIQCVYTCSEIQLYKSVSTLLAEVPIEDIINTEDIDLSVKQHRNVMRNLIKHWVNIIKSIEYMSMDAYLFCLYQQYPEYTAQNKLDLLFMKIEYTLIHNIIMYGRLLDALYSIGESSDVIECKYNYLLSFETGYHDIYPRVLFLRLKNLLTAKLLSTGTSAKTAKEAINLLWTDINILSVKQIYQCKEIDLYYCMIDYIEDLFVHVEETAIALFSINTFKTSKPFVMLLSIITNYDIIKHIELAYYHENNIDFNNSLIYKVYARKTSCISVSNHEQLVYEITQSFRNIFEVFLRNIYILGLRGNIIYRHISWPGRKSDLISITKKRYYQTLSLLREANLQRYYLISYPFYRWYRDTSAYIPLELRNDTLYIRNGNLLPKKRWPVLIIAFILLFIGIIAVVYHIYKIKNNIK
ncbi:hypothetical protein NEOKW01_0260 [Nematocida sp. AWRm80]|nr:hypothetical protein NEOKW01_0260 [Nematocida sp. AWRm80]